MTTDSCAVVAAPCTTADVDWPAAFAAQDQVGCCTVDSYCHFSVRIVPPASGNVEFLGCGLRRETARCVGGLFDGTPCPKLGTCSPAPSACMRDADCTSSCTGGTRPGAPCATGRGLSVRYVYARSLHAERLRRRHL